MDELEKIHYSTPEVVDFKWMKSFGDCISHGSGDSTRCSANGSTAGGTKSATKGCTSVGLLADNTCKAGLKAF